MTGQTNRAEGFEFLSTTRNIHLPGGNPRPALFPFPMRTVTVTHDLFLLGELSPQAQEKAYHDWLNLADYGWHRENTATLEAFCRLFEVECRHWSYDAYTYQYRFEMCAIGQIEQMTGVRLLKLLTNHYWEELFLPKTYFLRYQKRRKSRIFRTNDCVLTGYCMDYDILQPVYDFLAKPDPQVSFRTLIDHCLDSFFRACMKDCEYQFSMENFKELSAANDWEYLDNGRLFVAMPN